MEFELRISSTLFNLSKEKVMYYMEQIRYAGEPSKVVLPEGGYLFTLAAREVPVTHLLVAEMLGLFSWNVRTFQREEPASKKCVFHFQPNDLHTAKFIGEQEIIFDTLFQMFLNSYEAGATRFVIEVLESDTHVFFITKDDGNGIPAPIAEELMKTPITTKCDGLGFSMFSAVDQLAKIGAVLSCEGCANLLDANRPGASFKISFPKEMPKVA
jgi:hypothetical protein